jgi:thioredoxin reductase (NADPH)
MKTAMFLGDNPGGQMTTTGQVENYPGFISISGPELIQKLIDHAKHYGTELINSSITFIKKIDNLFVLLDNEKNEFRTKSVILATGACHKKLGIHTEEIFEKKGISYCPVCDGSLFKNQNVAIVGGGNSATEAAIYLSNIVKKLFIIHRGDKLRSEKILQERLFKLKNVEFFWNTKIIEFQGNDLELTAVRCQNNMQKVFDISLSGVFICVGYKPNSELGNGWIDIDNEGYAEKSTEPGFFIAGDVHDKKYKQAATAIGSGCSAALDAIDFIQKSNF